MRNSLMALFILLAQFGFGQNVPNTSTFSQQNVSDVVGGNSLNDCFTNSNAAFFDANYGSKTMNPKTLYGFRNYTVIEATAPSAWTSSIVENITGTSAVGFMRILSDGGSTILSSGICYGTSANPTILDQTTSNGEMSGLTPLTTYHIRAFATNAIGTGYGDDVSFTTIQPSIGDFYQGGIVAYIFQSGDQCYVAGQIHGIICSTEDQTRDASWSLDGYQNFNLGTQHPICYGSPNTDDIIANYGVGVYAASICRAYTGGGYTDWFLPSYNELLVVYGLRDTIGGFDPRDLAAYSVYWTSSELITSPTAAVAGIDFRDGTLYSIVKSSTNKNVRAIRYF